MPYALRFALCCLLVLIVAATSDLGAQPIAGRSIYNFLNLSPSARVSGLGGNLITVRDRDLSLGYQNPAALNPEMHTALIFNHSFHPAGINYGYAAYGHHVDKIGTTFQAGFQYVAYGEFDLTDQYFQNLGTFKASETAFNIGAGKAIYDRLSVGANLKLINSRFETYSSFGFSADVAATYFDTASRFTASLVIRNMGMQISRYREGQLENLPFDVQLGFSKQLKYLPFRISVIYHNLHRWNIIYDDPNVIDDEGTIFGEEPTERSDAAIFIDNFFRHFIFSGEFLFGKRENFSIRLAYNHMRRKEMLVSGFGSMAGFSFGFGFRIRQFRFDYGYSGFHNAGGLNHIGISTRIAAFRNE